MKRATTAILSLGPNGLAIEFGEPSALKVFSFVLEGPPVPKARARKGCGGRWYTPTPTRQYERAIRNAAIVALPRNWPIDADYRVTVRLFFQDARRRDVENCGKSVGDALNPKRGETPMFWNDDSQIEDMRSIRGGIDRVRPRTEVLVEVIR